MQDVYDFFYDVNSHLSNKGLQRLDEMLRPAIMSGVLSDMFTASLAKHSRVLTKNRFFNGHPDLVVQGVYAHNVVKAGTEGVEIKSTGKTGGAVDTHGAREQWMCVFVYNVDEHSEPARDRQAMAFTEVYLGSVTIDDFRKNRRSELGTRTDRGFDVRYMTCIMASRTRPGAYRGHWSSMAKSMRRLDVYVKPRKPCTQQGASTRTASVGDITIWVVPSR